MMLGHYLRSLWANLRREPFNSAVAVTALAVGLLAAFLLFSYCRYYLDYDHSVADHDQWYRLRLDARDSEGVSKRLATFYMDSPRYLSREIRGIADYLVIWNNYLTLNLTIEGKPVPFNKVHFVTPGFPKAYNLKLIHGRPDSLFSDPRNLLLSRTRAEQIFGRGDPVGKWIDMNGHKRFHVSGVFEDLPRNLHIRNDAFTGWRDADTVGVDDYHMSGYVLLKIPNPGDVPRITSEITRVFHDHPGYGNKDYVITPHLDPLTRIHFIRGLEDDQWTMDRKQVIATGVIGLMILVAALLNFINLLALGWRKRTDEFSFRRSVGAGRSDLFRQLSVEFGFHYLVAVLLALGLYAWGFGSFGRLVDLDLGDYSLFRLPYLPILAASLPIAGIIAGSLSTLRYSRMMVLNEEQRHQARQTGNLILLFVQIVIGAVFIVSGLIVTAQMRFVQKRDLGWNHANTVEYYYITTESMAQYYSSPRAVCDSLRSIPGVTCVTASYPSLVMDNPSEENMLYRIPLVYEEGGKRYKVPARYFLIYTDGLEKRGFTLLRGRAPAVGNRTELAVNKTFADLYFPGGDPVGKTVRTYPKDPADSVVTQQIVGVIKDAWLFPAYVDMPPMIFPSTKQGAEHFQITFDPNHKAEVLRRVEDAFAGFARGKPFGYRSVDIDTRLREFYAEDMVFANLSLFFALVTALVSAMGIHSTSSLHIRGQMKDIAIRKVCGAETGDLFRVYARPYLFVLAGASAVGVVLARLLTLLFLDRYTVVAKGLIVYYPIGIAILVLLVLGPLYLNILRAGREDPSGYLQSE